MSIIRSRASQSLRRGFGLVIGFINNLRIYNTASIKVSLYHTLPIPLQYSTYNGFKSQANISQAELLYSSVLVPIRSLLVCLFACFYQYYSFVTALNSTGIKVKVTLRLTVSQSVSQTWCRAPYGADDQIFITL
jgi:hypothetical protein